MLKKINILLFLSVFGLALVMPLMGEVLNLNVSNEVFASPSTNPFTPATGTESGAINLNDSADEDGVKSIVDTMFMFAQTISGIIFGVAVLMIVWAGFKYATSQGDTKVTEQAKMQIITAGIGIGIALFSLVIVQIFGNVMGVNRTEAPAEEEVVTYIEVSETDIV